MRYGVCNDYINTKKMFELEGFNVKHLFTDTRDDWGDDGGYLIAISEKKGKTYLQILSINYNGVIDSHNLDEERFEANGGFPDFITFPNVDGAKEFLTEFVRVLDMLVKLSVEDKEDDEFYGEDPEEFEAWLNENWDEIKFKDILSITKSNAIPLLSEFMFACFFPYSEYSDKDRVGILGMTEINYEFVEEEEEDED